MAKKEIIDEPVATEAADRSSRNKDTRKASTRPVQWRPANKLHAPDAPDGFVHRWIRAETLGQEDKSNVHRRLQEGFELVRADEYNETDYAVVQDGKYKGVIGQGGLVLARVPEEIAKQYAAYYQQQAREQNEAFDNDLMKEEHPSMPISVDRNTRVTFGGTKK